MSNINMEITASSLTAVADYFEKRAQEHRSCGESATRKIDKARWEGKAQGMEMAADILRRTTINSDICKREKIEP